MTQNRMNFFFCILFSYASIKIKSTTPLRSNERKPINLHNTFIRYWIWRTTHGDVIADWTEENYTTRICVESVHMENVFAFAPTFEGKLHYFIQSRLKCDVIFRAANGTKKLNKLWAIVIFHRVLNWIFYTLFRWLSFVN